MDGTERVRAARSQVCAVDYALFGGPIGSVTKCLQRLADCKPVGLLVYSVLHSSECNLMNHAHKSLKVNVSQRGVDIDDIIYI